MIDALTGDNFDAQFRTFLRGIDALVCCSVKNMATSAPPGSPANGDAYVVLAPGSGAWTGHNNAIAVWSTDNPAAPSGEWEFYPGTDGMFVYSVADVTFFALIAGVWTQLRSILVSYVAAVCEKLANKGIPNGYAGLDSTGHVPLSEIPAGLTGALQYQGTWDANANSPALASGVGSAGYFYKVSVAGSTVIDTNTNWHIGDLIIFDGTVWDKVDNYEAVTTVAGRTGAIVLAESDITSLVSDLAAKATSSALTAETSSRVAGDATNATAITTETTRAETAEALSEQLANKGVASGYAGLDGTGKVPAAQSLVMSVAGRTGTIVLAESDVASLVSDLAATEKTANKGAASGYASLDGTGHLPLSQIPAGVAGALQYQGTWDASANSPVLVGGVGTKGFFYKVSVAGSTVIDTNTNWHIGDLIIFDGTVWDKIDNYELVTSVAGRTGTIVLAESDITNLTTDLAAKAPLASPGLTGTPTAPTAAALTSSTVIATTAYADTADAIEKARALAAEALLSPLANPTTTGSETLDNPTAATSTVSQSSPLSKMSGRYWTGSASGTDFWTFQVVLANGTNGASTLALAHSGSSGLAALQLPSAAVLEFSTDTGLSRLAASTLAIGNGAAGDVSGVLRCQTIGGTGANVVASIFASGFYAYGASAFAAFWDGGVYSIKIQSGAGSGAGVVALGSAAEVAFSSTTTGGGANDTGISRTAAGTIAIGNGTVGNKSGTVTLTNLILNPASGAPTSAATAGVTGQLMSFGGVVYFCSVGGAAGSATWNKLNMTAV
jgi:hypothetical protein